MFATGDTTPRLGIDLAGGTSVTLQAKPDQGSGKNAVSADSMNTAVQIIRDRVNAFGVSEAEVQTQGSDHIVINIPKGKGEKEAAAQVGQTAKLYFRPVLAAERLPVTPQQATASPSPNASQSPSGSPSPSGTPAANQPQGQATSAPPSGSATPTATGSAKATATSSATAKPQSRVIPNLKDETPAPTGGATTPPPFDMSSPGGVRDRPDAAAAAHHAGPQRLRGHPRAAGQVRRARLLEPGQPRHRQRHRPDQGDGRVRDQAAGRLDREYILGPAAIDGTDVKSSNAQLPPQGQAGGWEVALKFDGSGTNKFAGITGDLAGGKYPTNRFAVELDGTVVVAPSVQQELPGGQAVITGSFSQKEAKNLANVLKFGALPLSFEQSEVATVSAALGSDQLRGGLIAGAIGMFLVMVYSIAYYRGLGVVSLISLLVSAILTFGVMSVLGRGIGFALEPARGLRRHRGHRHHRGLVHRLLRTHPRRSPRGRSLQPAVFKAWPRARRTILVSDFVSFLAAAVLYWVSVGKVKGFAFTLGLTTLLDIVVVFLFTKPLMVILARKKFFASGHPWSGLDPKRLGAKTPKLAYRATRRPASASAPPNKEA
ncbi:SecDF P1 head subdomain-containing protein [Yinghuangia aomiensis]